MLARPDQPQQPAAHMCKLLFIVLVELGAGCAMAPSSNEQRAPDHYFREGALEPGYPEIDELYRQWFSKALRLMREPTLAYAGPTGSPTCRFLYLRSFDPLICVRIEHHVDGPRVTSTLLDVDLVADRPGPPPLPERREFVVQEPTWAAIMDRLDESALWLPRGSTEDELLTTDGAQWVLELRDGETYRVTHRHSPRADGPYAEFRQLCVELLSVGRAELSPSEIY